MVASAPLRLQREIYRGIREAIRYLDAHHENDRLEKVQTVIRRTDRQVELMAFGAATLADEDPE